MVRKCTNGAKVDCFMLLLIMHKSEFCLTMKEASSPGRQITSALLLTHGNKIYSTNAHI